MTRFDVAVDIGEQTLPVGVCYTHVRQRTLSTTFTYAGEYFQNAVAYELEPALPFSAGPSHHEGLPYCFRDASPDRWGRNLIDRQFQAEHAVREITELDYLLRTSDATRQGALRFRGEGSEEFEATSTTVPKLLSLPELLAAARQVAEGETGGGRDLQAVKTLLDAGTASLGGARPKASVSDEGTLYLAKFPHPNDRWNVMRWEKIALDLAKAAGVDVPENRLVDIDGSSVLLLRRFDRDGANHRVGYLSATTLLQRPDGQPGDYLEIAEALQPISEAPLEDLAQLWRRALVSVMLHNTDDHLRNHGFLRGKSGWRLSPAFDLNPNPEVAASRATSINGAATAGDEWPALWEAREWFRLSAKAAREIADEVSAAFRSWRDIARTNGATDAELRLFAPVLGRERVG